MEKHIKKSNRGLTFSFHETEHLHIGSRYDYLITKQGIRIVASEKGRYKVSRKRNGSSWSPLIDLRNKEVLETIAKLGDIRLSIMDDAILVSKADAKGIVLQRCTGGQRRAGRHANLARRVSCVLQKSAGCHSNLSGFAGRLYGRVALFGRGYFGLAILQG